MIFLPEKNVQALLGNPWSNYSLLRKSPSSPLFSSLFGEWSRGPCIQIVMNLLQRLHAFLQPPCRVGNLFKPHRYESTSRCSRGLHHFHDRPALQCRLAASVMYVPRPRMPRGTNCLNLTWSSGFVVWVVKN